MNRFKIACNYLAIGKGTVLAVESKNQCVIGSLLERHRTVEPSGGQTSHYLTVTAKEECIDKVLNEN